MSNYTRRSKKTGHNFSIDPQARPSPEATFGAAIPTRGPEKVDTSPTRIEFLEIPLVDGLRISADEHNFKLQRKIGSNTSEKSRWRTIGYLSSFPSALRRACDEIIRRQGQCTLVDLCRLLLDLTHEIAEIAQECQIALQGDQAYLERRRFEEASPSSVVAKESGNQNNHQQNLKEDENENKRCDVHRS